MAQVPEGVRGREDGVIRMEKNEKIFDIYPNESEFKIPDLKENKTVDEVHKISQEETMTNENYMVFEWKVPEKIAIDFDPKNIVCEMQFEPYSINKEYINEGLTVIFIKRKDGKKDMVYAGGSAFCNPDLEISKVGMRRRWQKKEIAHEGDRIAVAFLSKYKISPVNTVWNARVTMIREK